MNLYEVEVTISQIDGYNSRYANYSKKEYIVSFSKEQAEKEVKYLLECEIKNIIKNKSYVVAYFSRLMLEGIYVGKYQ